MMKNKKRNNGSFKRTKDFKAEIAIGIAFMFVLGAISVMSVTRTITGSSDTIETYIRNSNGNYWEATGSNIQTAIYDFNSTDGHGTVTVPPGTYDLSSGINITRDKITLFGYGATLRYTSAIQDAFITIGDTHSASNITILGFSFDGSNQTVDNGHAEIGIEWTMTGCGIVVNNKNDVGTENTFIRDCYFKDIPNEGIGIYDLLDEGENINTRIDNCVFDHIGFRAVHPHYDHMIMVTNCLFKNMNDSFYDAGVTCEGFEYCIRHGTTITDNTFMNITAGDGVIYGSDSNSLITDNNFYNINSSVTAVIQTWALGEGDSILNNYFCDCQATYTILVNSGSGANIVGNEFVRCAVDNVIRASGNNTAIKANHFNNLTCSYGIAIYGTQCQVIGNTFEHTDTTDDPSAYIYIDNACDGNLMITDNSFDRTVMDYWEMISYHGSYSGTGDMINNNKGHDYDSLHDDKIWNTNGKYWVASGDITTNLQAAIDDLTTGGTVTLPVGTFDINANQIVMDDSIVLQGAGINATILRVKSGVTHANGLIHCNDINNFTIRDLTIYGNRDNAVGLNGINIYKCEDFIVENVYMHFLEGNGIRVYDECTRGFISNIIVCNVTGAFHGVSVGSANFAPCGNITVSDCIVSDCADWSYDFSNCVQCILDNCVTYNTYGGLKIVGSSHRCMVNNFVAYDIDTAASTNRGFWTEKSTYITVSNMDLTGGYYGIVITGTATDMARHITFSNVNIVDTSDDGLEMIDTDVDNVTFTNLYIENTGDKPLNIQNVDNIYFDNLQIFGGGVGWARIISCSNITMLGGYIRNTDTASYFLEFSNVDGWRISNMDMRNNVGDFNIVGACKDWSITNCRINNNGGGLDIDASAHDWYIILGNNLRGNNNDDDGTGANKVVADNLGTWI